MQTNVILTGAAVPKADSALAAPLQIPPDVHLVIAWSPVVRDADFRRALEIGLAKGSDGFFLARGRLTRLCGRTRLFAIFLIFEFGLPYTGLYRVSPAAPQQTIEFMGK
jgi:hypothetical protein